MKREGEGEEEEILTLHEIPQDIHNIIISFTDYPTLISLLFTCKECAKIVKFYIHDYKKTPHLLQHWRSEMIKDAAFAGYTSIVIWMKTSFYGIKLDYDVFIEAMQGGGHLEIMKSIEMKHTYKISIPNMVFYQCVEFGKLDTIQYLVNECFCPLNDEIFNAVVKSQNLDAIKWLHEKKCPWNKSISRYAAKTGNLENMKWLEANGYLLYKGTNTFSFAAESGNFELLKWLKEIGCEWDEDTFGSAIIYGDLKQLKWLKENGCPWHWNSYSFALSSHKNDILEWLKENECPIHYFDVDNAAIYGNLDFMKWLVDVKGAEFTFHVFGNAVQSGNIEMLKWLKEKRCPLGSQSLIGLAIWNEDFTLVQWLKEGNMVRDWHEHDFSEVFRWCDLTSLQWFKENGLRWGDTTCIEALESKKDDSFEKLKWLMENGCPFDLGVLYEIALLCERDDVIRLLTEEYKYKPEEEEEVVWIDNTLFENDENEEEEEEDK